MKEDVSIGDAMASADKKADSVWKASSVFSSADNTFKVSAMHRNTDRTGVW